VNPGPRRAAHPVHEQIATTNIYLHADMSHKQRAIDKTRPLDSRQRRPKWHLVPGSGERLPGSAEGAFEMRRLLIVPLIAITAMLFTPVTPGLAAAGQHAAITITSNAGFSVCSCVTSGNGTAANPYIIGPWAIAAPSGGPAAGR
jgi:hypothetical protein